MAVTDRISGLSIGVAVKPSCVVATTASITLSGTQSIDGVSVGANSERVLVWNQNSTSENGIYIADSSTWVRAKDCDGKNDLIPGSIVYVDRGDTYGVSFFAFNSSSTSQTITVGTDNIVLSLVNVAVTGASNFIVNSWWPVTSASAARSVISALASTEAAQTTSTNTFTPIQAFSTSLTVGGNITMTSTSGSSTPNPTITINRNSTTPGANDSLGLIKFLGENSTSESIEYASLQAAIIDETDGSEDGDLTINTVVAGSTGDRFHFRSGMYASTATGGDQGSGTINTAGVYKNGQEYSTGETVYGEVGSTTGTSVTLSTSVYSTAVEIHVVFHDLAVDSSAPPLIHIGTNSSLESTSYFTHISGTQAASAETDVHGFLAYTPSGYSSSLVMHADLVLTRNLSTGTRWTASIQSISTASNAVVTGMGYVDIGGDIGQLIAATSSTTTSFSTGRITFSYR